MGTPKYPKDLSTEMNRLHQEIKGAFTSANSRMGTVITGSQEAYFTADQAKYTNPPQKNTTDALTTHHVMAGVRQHPRFHLRVYVYATSDDVAEVSVQNPDTGNTLASVATSPGGSGFYDMDGDHEVSPGQFFQYNIRVRRISGSGSGVGVTPVAMYGIQS